MKLKLKLPFLSFASAKKTILKHKIDILLLAGSAASFGMYAKNSLDFNDYIGNFTPVASLLGGTAMRKEAGTSALLPASPGTKFFNMDAIWVPEKAEATLLVGTDTRVLVEEKTLLIFKRPFKSDDVLQRRLKVVTGKATILFGSNKGTTIQRENRLSEIPDHKKAKTEQLAAAEEAFIKPPSGGIVYYYVRQSEPPVTFAWPKPIQGFLVITARSGASANRVIYKTLKDQTSLQVPLPIQASYTWQVLGENGKTILHGPFPFEIRAFDQAEVRKAMMSGGAAKIQVIMKE